MEEETMDLVQIRTKYENFQDEMIFLVKKTHKYD
jgi:hypothetical protein